MTTDTLLKTVVDALDDGKAKDIKSIDVRDKTSVADFMVIASGTSERHIKFLADHVIHEVKKHHERPLGVEGESGAEWVLVDLGDVILHVMLPQTRAFYQLEKLWDTDFTAVSANAG